MSEHGGVSALAAFRPLTDDGVGLERQPFIPQMPHNPFGRAGVRRRCIVGAGFLIGKPPRYFRMSCVGIGSLCKVIDYGKLRIWRTQIIGERRYACAAVFS